MADKDQPTAELTGAVPPTPPSSTSEPGIVSEPQVIQPPPNPIQMMTEHAKRVTSGLFGAGSDRKSDAEIVLQMMNKILSSDNIEQKSRQTFENIVGISRAYVIFEAMIEGSAFTQVPDCDGFQFTPPSQIRENEDIKKMIADQHGLMASLKTICDQMTIRLVSKDGLGREELIKLAQAFSFTIQQHEHERDLADRLIGQKGMMRR